MKFDVVVVGSYNQDMVWRTARFPRPGETRLGEFSTGPGGKGFNQAVAAARQDAHTAFIGAIGRDALGGSMLALAAGERIHADCEQLETVATGTAAILVEASGENLIVVGSGANAAFTAAHVEARRATIESARVLMTQHEVPDSASMAAMRIARSAGLLCLHNPAPPRDGDIRPLLRLADVLTPNESELGLLLKSRGGELASIRRPGALDDDTLHALCRQIEVPTVVLTLGARGVFVSHRDDTLRGDVSAHYRVAAEAVNAVDTTGAGDAFSGALAAQLAAAPEAAFVDSVRYASRVAALSTEIAGAALSIPRRADVLGALRAGLNMQIGPYRIDPPVILAPMAGVTDKPFRQLCKRLGAGLAVSEMTSADPTLRNTRKSLLRRDHADEPAPISVQIAGTDPLLLADAARFNVDLGAQIIDINMGCPAKKVCNAWAGSALMRDEWLVARILEAVVRAVEVPVTLKIRTGWCQAVRNGPRIARIAEDCGVQALAVHGRTREQLYHGEAEYDTIALIKSRLRIPVIANGDIDCLRKARAVLAATGADAVMIGRAAQGRPWLPGQIAAGLASGIEPAAPGPADTGRILLGHLDALYAFYGEVAGVRIARKHIGWYVKDHPADAAFRAVVNRAERADEQRRLTAEYFSAVVAGDAGVFRAAA